MSHNTLSEPFFNLSGLIIISDFVFTVFLCVTTGKKKKLLLLSLALFCFLIVSL